MGRPAHGRVLTRVARDAQQPAVPLAAAGLIVVDDDHRVLMAQRPTTARFAPGAWVFPGGLVETHDGLDNREVTDESASQLALDAYRVAAVRECLEETGVACLEAAVEPAVMATVRQRLLAGGGLMETLAAEGVEPALPTLHYVGFWTTPPMSPLRYSTRFFMTAAPDHGLNPEVDGVEIVDACWITPADALQRHRQGGFALLPPQSAQLRHFAALAERQRLLDWAQAGPAVLQNRAG